MRILVLMSCLLLAACGGESRDTQGEMAVERTPLVDDGVMPVIDLRMAWVRPHPAGRDVTAAYFTLYLAEGSADRLVAARIDGASSVELHGHTIADNGMMQMRPIEAQDVVAGAPLIFAPGGRHLMVHGLAAVAEGDTVSGVLVFERAGEIGVNFQVQSIPPGSPTDY
jgi:copper(I)-binding protein